MNKTSILITIALVQLIQPLDATGPPWFQRALVGILGNTQQQ